MLNWKPKTGYKQANVYFITVETFCGMAVRILDAGEALSSNSKIRKDMKFDQWPKNLNANSMNLQLVDDPRKSRHLLLTNLNGYAKCGIFSLTEAFTTIAWEPLG